MLRTVSIACLLMWQISCTDDPSTDVDDEEDPRVIAELEPWDEDVTTIAACANALPAIDAEAPIFTYYGAYRPSSGLAPRVDGPQTLALEAPGERVITLRRKAVGCVPMVNELKPWLAGGGLVAHVMTIEELGEALVKGTAAAKIEGLLRSGYAYVAIDELALPNVAWRNGGSRVAPFKALLTTLAAAGLDRRIIFYVNSYNLVGKLGLYSHVLRALRDHARIIASEIYVTTRDVKTPVTQSNGRCNRSTRCFESIAAEMRAAAPNINYRTITVLGVADEYSQGASDALCEGPDGLAGSLYRQYSKLHQGALTSLQPGVGAYTFVRIERTAHPAWGASDHVECKNRLDNWSWPRARD